MKHNKLAATEPTTDYHVLTTTAAKLCKFCLIDVSYCINYTTKLTNTNYHLKVFDSINVVCGLRKSQFHALQINLSTFQLIRHVMKLNNDVPRGVF